jgi:hypothetical protein
MPEPSRFWEVPPDDVAPAVTNTPTPKRATAADLRQAAERRWQVHERALQALAGSSLAVAAPDLIPWKIVAQRAATVFAPAFYTTLRIGQYTAKADGFALAPADPAVLHDLESEQAKTLTTLFAQNEAYRRQAGMLLLIEAWASLMTDDNGDDATITTTLETRLAEPNGWEWLAGFPIDISDLAGDQDGNWNTERARTLGTISAFNADGYGRTPNDVLSIGARHALSADHTRWNVEAWPVFTHENSAGKALYSPSRTHFPTARDAMRAVESYGSAHVAMLKYITAKHLANSNAQTRGPYGGFYMSVEEFLVFRGIKKQSAGGYRTEDRREIIELIEALEHIEVTGSVEGYEKGRRGKRSSLTIRSPLIVVSHRVTQSSTPGSEKRPIAWYLRAGDWAAELNRYGPQFAVTTKALLQLNTQNDMHAFNLGNHLTEEYRIRASQQKWKQPHRVWKLLENAEIEVDRKHAGRFRERIEAALDVLTNPVDMQNTPIIESWHYDDIVEAKGRGWFDRWLDSGIVINPPAGLIRPYQAMGRRKLKQPLASVKG